MKANSPLKSFLCSTFLALVAGTLLLLPAHGETIRGLGEVSQHPITAEGLSGFSYQCDSPEHAVLLMHKVAHDMSPTSTVATTWQTAKIGDLDVPVLVRAGFGSFLFAAKEKTVFVYTSPVTDNSGSAFASLASSIAGAHFYDAAYRYPMYLDKFSSRGIGSWYPYGWGQGFEGRPNSVDDHFTFAKQYDLTVQPSAGGTVLRNLLPKLHEYDRPFHFAQWLGWTPELAMLAPEDLVHAGKDFTNLCSYYGQISDGAPKLMAYRNWVFQQTVKEFVDEENLVDWLDPNGEVGPPESEVFWDFSENNRSHFAGFLRERRGYSLETLGKAWHGRKDRFASWSAVPIPLGYDWFGLEPDSIRPDPNWKFHTGDVDEKLAAGKKEIPGFASVGAIKVVSDEGLKSGYQLPEYDDHGWPSFLMPGGEIPMIYDGAHRRFWYRSTLDVPANWLKSKLAQGRIYLNVAVLSQARNSLDPDHYWINGQEIGSLSLQPGHCLTGWIDVTDVVKPGKNSIVYHPHSEPLGPLFLGSKPMETYPYKDAHLNARYIDWIEYVHNCIEERMENTLKAIRGVDPNRFVKMHAAIDKDLIIPLEAKYGGFGHNTGDEAFFRPWDKRFGYPRGVPSSAESSASQPIPHDLKRWIGWWNFTGNNAFDNFHNIQSMMYDIGPTHYPTAEIWKEYLPYLHLGNRRDIKRPDIGLFSSSRNSRLLERSPVLCLDLGRGDLQPLGYSYVYLDESSLRDHLCGDYPVIWDSGTWVMDRETVARLKEYVEAGGTYVALQETGRHTLTERDAWPISDLTGFKVREIREMKGIISILHDQPLFTQLAGKSFDNIGRSIDYSNFNTADKCIALEAVAPGTQVIARYGDGSIAIGMRKLGKGRVVVLGSPFWRDSYDSHGTWYPGEGQNVFLEDIFHGLGLKPLATANSHTVWREHYLANNGTEEYLVLWNSTDEPQTVDIGWTTVHPAQSLYDPKNGQPVAGKIDGTNVQLEKMTLAPMQTFVVAAAVSRPPQEALQDWFKHIALWLRPSAPGEILKRPDLPVYQLPLVATMKGKQASETDLAQIDCAELSTRKAVDQSWSHTVGFSPDANKKLPGNQCFVFHVAFDLPTSWKSGQEYKLSLKMPNESASKVDAWLNGKQVLKGEKTNAVGNINMVGGSLTEVGSALQFGNKNVLVFTTGSLGFMGEAAILHQPVVAESFDVTGEWQVQSNEDSGFAPVALPGTFEGLFAVKRDVSIPASWNGSRVCIDLDVPDKHQFSAAIINDKVLFLPLRTFPSPVTHTDITPWVKFGQPNTLYLVPSKAAESWHPGPVKIDRVSFQRMAQ